MRGGPIRRRLRREQYVLPDAVTLLRAVRKRGGAAFDAGASDRLYFRGVLTPAPEAQTA